MAERLPRQSQQATLRALGDDGLRKVVDRYVDAWERADVDAILALLAEDATLAMPPLATWYRGRDAIALFLTRFALRDRWRLIPARANGQLAFGAYAQDPGNGRYIPLSLDLLTLEGTQVTQITCFVAPATHGPARERFAVDVFKRFGMPDRIE